jgi:hypothetical protein
MVKSVCLGKGQTGKWVTDLAAAVLLLNTFPVNNEMAAVFYLREAT